MGTRVSRQVRPERTLVDTWLDHDGAVELVEAAVLQPGQAAPATRVTFGPAIPDLRRPFSGRVEGRFVIDVNGQESHATGDWAAWWGEDGPHLAITPTRPWWVADRPMETTVVWGDGAAQVRIARRPAEAGKGRGAKGRSP